MLGNNVVYYWRKNKALQKALEANFKDLKISTVKEEIGRYPENTRKERHTSKPAGCWNEQNSHRKKTKKKTPHLPHQGNKIVIKLEDGILGVTIHMLSSN